MTVEKLPDEKRAAEIEKITRMLWMLDIEQLRSLYLTVLYML